MIGAGDTYAANFHDASGLKSGDDVTVAGVRVGSVKSISLVRKHVHVTFRVKDTWIGDASTAHIQIASLLGEEKINIDPEGEQAQKQSKSIPLAPDHDPDRRDLSTHRARTPAPTHRHRAVGERVQHLVEHVQGHPRHGADSVGWGSRESRHTIASRDRGAAQVGRQHRHGHRDPVGQQPQHRSASFATAASC